MKRRIFIAVVCLVHLLASAAVVVLDTTGYDNSVTEGFFGITFESGETNEYITGVGYLLNSHTAFFDFDGDGSYSNLFSPAFAPLTGVNAEDITWGGGNLVGFNQRHPGYLAINFQPGSFRVGESVRFAADTDGLPLGGGGGAFAEICYVAVSLNTGPSAFTNFSFVNSFQSTARLVVTNQIVLSMRLVSNQLELSWPLFNPLLQLEEAASLDSTEWVASATSPFFTNNEYRAVVPLNAASRFYRLREP